MRCPSGWFWAQPPPRTSNRQNWREQKRLGRALISPARRSLQPKSNRKSHRYCLSEAILRYQLATTGRITPRLCLQSDCCFGQLVANTDAAIPPDAIKPQRPDQYVECTME